jgi:hypothetical protein
MADLGKIRAIRPVPGRILRAGPVGAAMRLSYAAFVFPAILAVGPSLPPPTPSAEPAKVEEPKVEPPEDPCDDEREPAESPLYES